jgi:hypothetical protein
MPNMIYLLQHADIMEDVNGSFYVIEKFPEPQFVIDTDGNIKEFDNYFDALEEANDCQDGSVIIL